MIGVCLDLDRGEASFLRNGRPLGVAFTGVRTLQPHLAYFPAVSLSYAERCELNFGAQPLQFPVEGFLPMQVGSGEERSTWREVAKESGLALGSRGRAGLTVGWGWGPSSPRH